MEVEFELELTYSRRLLWSHSFSAWRSEGLVNEQS